MPDLLSIARVPFAGPRFSEDAQRVRRPVPWMVDGASLSIDNAARELVSAVLEAAHEASRDNWDGYGALSIDQDVIWAALRFASMLPTAVSKPDVSVHPDGEIGFSWLLGKNQILTVSVSSAGILSFAGIIGTTRAHGSEPLLDELPEPMAIALRKLFSATL